MLCKYLLHLVNKANESSTPGEPYPLISQTNSVASLGENSCHGDWKIPTRGHALHQVMDIEDIPCKTPGMNPTRMSINLLHSRKASKEKCLNTLSSKMRNILKLLKRNLLVTATTHDCEEILEWITNQKTIMTVKNS